MGVWGTAILNDNTVIAFSASFAISLVLVLGYYRWYRSSHPATGKANLIIRRRVADDGDWGPSEAVGVDLGSYEAKAWLYDGSALKVVGTSRSIVSISLEGFRFGEVDFAKQYPESTFFSLPHDMTTGADAVIAAGEVEIKPYQACAALLKWLVSGRRVVAVGVPPYLNAFALDLYLAASCADISRLFIFRQSAALMAALLRYRRMEPSKARPARHVVFVDAGRSGMSAYLCEVRETAASQRREACRTGGMVAMEKQMVTELCKNLTVEQQQDPQVLAAIVEAAAEIRYEFASTPAYLLSNAKKSTRTRVVEGLTVELDRERFDEIFQVALSDAADLGREILAWLRVDALLDAQCDLVLSGSAFKLRELRGVFEPLCNWKSIVRDKVTAAQGLALLAAMRHPRFSEQRYDIEPLYELRTLDESGLRPTLDDPSGRGSFLSPLLGLRSSSNFTAGRGSKTGRKASNLDLLSKSTFREDADTQRTPFLASPPNLREAEST